MRKIWIGKVKIGGSLKAISKIYIGTAMGMERTYTRRLNYLSSFNDQIDEDILLTAAIQQGHTWDREYKENNGSLYRIKISGSGSTKEDSVILRIPEAAYLKKIRIWLYAETRKACIRMQKEDGGQEEIEVPISVLNPNNGSWTYTDLELDVKNYALNSDGELEIPIYTIPNGKTAAIIFDMLYGIKG